MLVIRDQMRQYLQQCLRRISVDASRFNSNFPNLCRAGHIEQRIIAGYVLLRHDGYA